MSNSKSSSVIQAKDVNPELLSRITKKFGEMDMDRDFFSRDLKYYYKTTGVDKETGTVSHKPIPLASFGNSLKKLRDALKALKSLSKTPEGKSDVKISDITQSLSDIFNKYRTHIRNSYPDQYREIRNLISEISLSRGSSSFKSGKGINYASPIKTKNKKSPYFYKLSEKKNTIKEEEKELSKLQKFQNGRIKSFEEIETELNSITVHLSNLKNETIQYYKDNPTSFNVVYPTDLVLDYIKDIKKLLKEE